MEHGADVSKAEGHPLSNGLAGIPTAEEAIGVGQNPALRQQVLPYGVHSSALLLPSHLGI